MFKKFYYDLLYSSRKKFSAKYTLPFLIALLCTTVIGLLATQFITISQLNEASGKVVNIERRVKSRSHNRTISGGAYTNNYALYVKLDNGQTFDIQDNTIFQQIEATVHKGDDLTVYYPTTVLKILSAGFARDVSEIDRGRQVLYSWKGQQKDNWFLISFFAALIAVFYWFMRYLRNSFELNTLG
jgi:hypothetical protein